MGRNREIAVNQVKEVIPECEDVIVPYYDKTSWKGTVYGQDLYFPTWKIERDHPLVKSGESAYKALFSKM